MKELPHNPLFYLSVVLVLILGFMVANLVGAFTEPGSAFPGGAPAAPLDTSGQSQTKTGILYLDELRLVDGEGGIVSPAGVCLYHSGESAVRCVSDWNDSAVGSPSQWLNGTGGVIYYNGGNVGIGTTDPGTYKLRVEGTAFSTGGWEASDARLKKNVGELSGALNKVLNLTGIYYDWRTDEYPTRGLPEGRQIGFIAQEVEKVFPELVTTDNAGYKALAYDRFSAILLEAIKEQQAQIEALNTRLQALEN